jgi:hypothetical protein
VVVPTGDDDAPRLHQRACLFLDDVSELAVEGFVDLVEQEDLRIALHRDGKSQPGAHPL